MACGRGELKKRRKRRKEIGRGERKGDGRRGRGDEGRKGERKGGRERGRKGLQDLMGVIMGSYCLIKSFSFTRLSLI